MNKKYRYGHWNFAIYVSAIIMLAALVFCFSMIHNINLRMNESATSNLLNTTQVIEGTLERYIEKDFETLEIVGELYKMGEYQGNRQIEVMCDTMGFEWIAVADRQGNGIDCFDGKFKVSDIKYYETWEPGKRGYSDAYFGDSGRLQSTLWVPVYRDNKFLGTIFGDVILSKYYSADVFTFYNGAGRTYLFDGSDGKWILRSLGGDGASRRQDNFYSLLKASGNDEHKVLGFQQAVMEQKTGTSVFNFNGEKSYVCFMPLSSSSDWYVVTVIADAVLLRESAQVRRMIQLIFTIFIVSIVFLTVTFATWQIRRAKAKEADYRENLFANISANIDSAFLVYEKPSEKTVFVSDNVKRLFGLERDWLKEDAGRLFDWCGILEDNPQRQDFMHGTLDKAAVQEVCVENEMGERDRYLRLELIPADLGQLIAVLTDITKDKDVQRSLLEAMKRAEAASKAKNDFLSAMSHDIRTPMNGVIGMTAIAAAHLGDKVRVKDCLNKINEASAHLLSLINEILDMSKIESGKIELLYEPFNLPEILQEMLNISSSGIDQKKHTLKVHIHSMEHEMVVGDCLQIRRIASNLISNAIKYTPEGGNITLDLQERPAIIAGYGCYVLTVQDDGIGMSEEFQKRLFQPFEREEDVRISKIQGTGLGMSIVKNLAALMMGSVQVESEKGKGTTVRVTLNLHLREEKEEKAENSKIAKLPVLIVDDDTVICETVTNMLSDIGMLGEWADNGAKAVEKVVSRHHNGADYMAVLLDWKMPEMDGVETARRIRKEVGEGVPIIILTAYDWSEIESEARAAGVDEFLSKPLYKAKLRQKMVNLAFGGTEKSEHSAEIAAKEILSGKRVLLVEDNDLNMEIAVELMQIMGIDSDSAENGAVAVERFESSKPGTYDLILMDIQMPKMNGYEATRAIRNLKRPDSQVPIVAMTADAFAKDVQLVRAAGMNEHLSKPISIERLRQILIRYLSEVSSEKENWEG